MFEMSDREKFVAGRQNRALSSITTRRDRPAPVVGSIANRWPKLSMGCS